jgi:tetratricopeptide (TPR) repeat protein
MSWHWDFGDGLSGEGKEVSHAYFRLGRPEVTLTVTDAAGNSDSTKLAPYLFQWDYVARARKYGEAKEYIEATASYDVEHMQRDDLALYAAFCGNLEQWARHVAAVRAYVTRFAAAKDLAAVVTPAIASCLQPQAYAPELAEEWLRLTLAQTEAPRERNDLLLRRAHVLAWHLDQPDAAGKLYDELEDVAARDPNDPYCRGLHRACLIGRGDAALVAADYARAEGLYRQAEDMHEKKRTAQAADRAATGPTIEVARSGSYVFIVEDLLARGEYGSARDELDKWEDECPLQKLEGYSFFLRGKVLFVEHPSELALRYLRLAERVAPRAVHVPETVWLRANCYLSLGRRDEARAELRRITVDFTSSEFLQRAAEKLKELEPRPPSDAHPPSERRPKGGGRQSERRP